MILRLMKERMFSICEHQNHARPQSGRPGCSVLWYFLPSSIGLPLGTGIIYPLVGCTALQKILYGIF
jgi:hypothetical protein